MLFVIELGGGLPLCLPTLSGHPRELGSGPCSWETRCLQTVDWISVGLDVITRLKSEGLSESPCLTPFLMNVGSELEPLIWLDVDDDLILLIK